MRTPTLALWSAPGVLHMSRTGLEKIADSVRRIAQREGFILPRQVRAELTDAGLDDGQWKDVLALIGPSLNYRKGRYYYVPPGSPRMRVRVRRDQRHHQVIDRAVRRLIRTQRAAEAVMIERRSARRISYVAPVEVRTADHRVIQMLTREMSVTGIRLIGTTALQGQKVHLWVPRPDRAEESHGFVVQVLWSSEVGDGLFENGGVFVDMVTEEESILKVVSEE